MLILAEGHSSTTPWRIWLLSLLPFKAKKTGVKPPHYQNWSFGDKLASISKFCHFSLSFFCHLDYLWCAVHNLCLTVRHKSQLTTYFISPQSFGRAEVWLIVFTWISGLALSDRKKGTLHAEVQLHCFSMRNQAIGSWGNL